MAPVAFPQITSPQASRQRRRKSSDNLFGENKLEFPSSQWESLNENSYKMFFTSGPPPKLPEIRKREPGRRNNPHAKNAYHIWKIDKEKVCDVKSSLLEDESAGTTRQSEQRASYQPQAMPTRPARTPDTAAENIVPVNNVAKIYDERILPACAKVLTMATSPALQYTGRKKKTKAPYADSGVFYEDTVSPIDGASVSSLCGMQFSRRKVVNGRSSALRVKGFDGGACSEDSSRGLRTGYWQTGHYLKLR